eukprot:6184088-Pleurochrysis_carterae.AAC.1
MVSNGGRKSANSIIGTSHEFKVITLRLRQCARFISNHQAATKAERLKACFKCGAARWSPRCGSI